MSATDDLPTIDNMLCFAIYAAEHAFARYWKSRLDALGLTYPQYLVFLVLWEQDGLTVKALGEKLFLDSGTLTPLLKRLEARGLVRRQRDEEDERQVRIYLTASGRDLKVKARVMSQATSGATGLDKAAADELRMSLKRLRETLRENVDA